MKLCWSEFEVNSNVESTQKVDCFPTKKEAVEYFFLKGTFKLWTGPANYKWSLFYAADVWTEWWGKFFHAGVL